VKVNPVQLLGGGLLGPKLDAQWPHEAWKADVIARGDWQPFPFQQFIVKLHSRCNLSCDYCYIYEMADSNWRNLPGIMSEDVVRQTARRIAEYVTRHGHDSVQVVYHGGEPLLVGRSYMDFVSTELRAALPAECRLDLAAQTNGVFLDDAMLRTLAAHEIRLGISIDGGPEANDRHRRYANGKGSYAQVAEGLARVNADYPHLLSMLLCVIDLANNPVETYEALLEFKPPAIDFLMPLGNWTTPPPGLPAADRATPYGDWLISVFDRWYSAHVQETDVRILQAVVDGILGRSSQSEVFGLGPAAAVEVETDGALHQICTLKSAFDGANCTGLDVFTHSFDDVHELPAMMARQAGLAALSPECLGCAIRDICGGGYYVHRYRSETGFRNPSVYCRDLMRLITHISSRVRTDLLMLSDGGTR
jgi:uncharacterized protein